MIRTILVAFALLFAASAPAFADNAIVRGLDKHTGHARDYALPIGRAVRIGTLEVIARACAKSAPEEAPEVRIYVEVYDHPPPVQNQPPQRTEIFHGWLFASSPGLNAVQHPVYDLWAIDCRS